MAWSTVETKIANPARGHMAKTKKKKKYNPPKHKKAKKSSARSHSRPKKKKAAAHRPRTKKNPELVSFLLGNPAKKGARKGMAHSKKKSAASHRSNAGRPRKKHSSHRPRTKKRGNPGMVGSPRTWLETGAGALAGFVGSAAVPTFFGPTVNTSWTGYALTAGAAIGLGMLSHMLLPRHPQVTMGVVAGGFANLLRRIITDQTPYGAYLNAPASQGGLGMGDYMTANWGPPRMQDGLNSAMAEAPGTPWGGGGPGMVTASHGVSMQDMADMRTGGGRPC